MTRRPTRDPLVIVTVGMTVLGCGLMLTGVYLLAGLAATLIMGGLFVAVGGLMADV